MDNMSLNRRSLLMAMGAISAGAPLGGVSAGGVQASGPKVLEAGHGEHLVHFRDGGNIFIYEGSDTWVFGTQQIKARGGWPASITSSAVLPHENWLPGCLSPNVTASVSIFTFFFPGNTRGI